MAGTTLTRTELTEALSQKTGISRQHSVEVLETVLEELVRGIIRDGGAKVSSFGTFAVRQKYDRVGRNPKTGQEVVIPPRKTLSFRASHILKNRVVTAPDQI